MIQKMLAGLPFPRPLLAGKGRVEVLWMVFAVDKSRLRFANTNFLMPVPQSLLASSWAAGYPGRRVPPPGFPSWRGGSVPVLFVCVFGWGFNKAACHRPSTCSRSSRPFRGFGVPRRDPTDLQAYCGGISPTMCLGLGGPLFLVAVDGVVFKTFPFLE